MDVIFISFAQDSTEQTTNGKKEWEDSRKETVRDHHIPHKIEDSTHKPETNDV